MHSSFPLAPEGFEDLANELINAKAEDAEVLLEQLDTSAQQASPLPDGRICTKDTYGSCPT